MTTWAKANSTRLLRLFVSHRVRRGHREKRKSKIKNQRAKIQSKNQNGNNRILRTGSDPFNYSGKFVEVVDDFLLAKRYDFFQ